MIPDSFRNPLHLCVCCSNPFDLGKVANFRECFDAHGRLWWLAWMMPSWRMKKGNGYQLPRLSGRARVPQGSAIPGVIESERGTTGHLASRSEV